MTALGRWQSLSRRARATYTGLAITATLVSVAGFIPPGARWYERVYRGHAQVGFVVASTLVLLLAIGCAALSMYLSERRQPAGGALLVETGPPPEFIHRLRSASQVDLIATTGLRFLQIHKQVLIEVLRNNGQLRVLVAKPRSQFLRDVRDMESGPARRRADLGGEIEMAYQTLQEMREETRHGRIQLGKYGTHMRSTIILIDQRVAWISLILPPKRAVETPGIYVPDDHNGRKYTNLAVEHLARIWAVLPAADKVEVS